MCSSPVSPLVDLTPAMIQIPSTPTNCAEVVGFHLLAALRQPRPNVIQSSYRISGTCTPFFVTPQTRPGMLDSSRR